MKKNRYIDGIDGLRALAVWAVLLFHGFPYFVRGGFIGVDIFFVISGFIITKVYYESLTKGKFSLRAFYLKRIRRLAPAYILIVFLVTCVSYLILPPPLLREFSSSLAAQPFYLQNFVFWSQGDYFVSALTRPLLHTWSLAVEEQFYLLYGLAILIAKRFPKTALAIIIFTTLGSYIGGSVLSVVSPKTTFFLLPARIWEFGVGFLIARSTNFFSIRWNYACQVIGLSLILFAIFYFDKNAYFPGIQSIMAVSGSALILATLTENRRSVSVLSSPLISYFGRISYSLYLWHWPIISLLSVYFEKQLGILTASAAVLLSWLLAHLTFYTIEQPVRNRSILSDDAILIRYSLVLGLVFLGLGSFFFYTYGAVYRYQEEVANLYRAEQIRSPYRCSYLERIKSYPSEICDISGQISRPEKTGSVLILGDSHADQLDEMIASEASSRGFRTFLTVRNCTLENFGSNKYCSKKVLKNVISEIRKKNIKYVFAISYTTPEISKEDFRNSVERLTEANIDRLFLMNTVPHSSFFNPAKHIADIRAGNRTLNSFDIDDYHNNTMVQRHLLRNLAAANPKISLLDPGQYICPNGSCDFEQGGKPLYFDSHHLSPTGAERLRPLYVFAFDEIKFGQRKK